MLLRRAGLSGCERVSRSLASVVNEMNIQQLSYFSVEIYFAALDTGPKKCTLPHVENGPSHTQTIGLNQSSNTHPITDIHFFHYSLSRNVSGGRQLNIIHRSTVGSQAVSASEAQFAGQMAAFGWGYLSHFF